MNPQMILVAGPCRSGTNDDPVRIAKNVEAMTDAALQLFRAGHLPVMGEWYALPLIEHAGSKRIVIRHSTKSSTPSRDAWWPNAMAAFASAASRRGLTRWSVLLSNTGRPCTTRSQRSRALRGDRV